jgi:malonate-semialdehyde dehydrogenase (acetylating)/methylmalonate-semialdehyde dehydrogenase
MAISVAVAVGDAADKLVPVLAQRVKTLKIDQSQNGAADMGPLITAAHRD